MYNIFLEEVDSTNLFAKKILDNLADKSIIQARHQTAGRGRMQRSWIDLGGDNLFLSIVLKPSEKFNNIYSNLTQYLSVVVCKLLEEYGLQPQIKWPNDVLIDGAKIAGILCETVMQGQSFKGLVLGIGVNLNSSNESLNLINKSATALNLLTGHEINTDEFLNKLTDRFFKDYDEFLDKGFEFFRTEYIKRACFIGKEISVQVFNDKKSGIVKDINKSGELVLIKENKEFVLTIGDIL